MTTPPDPRLVLAVLERATDLLEAGRASAVGVLAEAATSMLSGLVRGPGLTGDVWRAAANLESRWRVAEWGIAECGSVVSRSESLRGAATIVRSHILTVCLFCGALAGALPIEARRLIAAYCGGDADALLGLADLVEERGLTGPLAQWAEERQGWLEVTEHEHVWLPWVSGDEKRALRDCLGPPDFDLIRRCTCGTFEHETRRRPRKKLTVAARRRLDALCDRAVREFRGHRADRIFVDDPPTVHDE